MEVPGGFTRAALATAAGLAALSLLLPFAPVFDAWAWLIWARDLSGGELDTSAGASWKPLPVLLALPLTAAGDAAPELWLLLSRAGWLMSLALAGRIAWRLAGAAGCGPRRSLLAGLIAALGLLLVADGFTPWIRQFAGGLSEPLLVAVLLGAVEAQMAGRGRLVLGLLVVASLIRPEVWPFLAGYAVWSHRRGQLAAPALGLIAGAVAALWLLPDLIGSGNALTGASRARADTEGPLTNGLEALWRSFNLAPVALLAAAVAWIAGPWAGTDRSGRAARGLALAALAWAGIVIVMALFGYAGLPRFALPAGALACSLGAAGLVVLRERGGGGMRWGVALLAVALVVQGGLRATSLPGELADAAAYREELDDLRRLARRLGPEIAGCQPLSTSQIVTQSALAWELGVGVGEIELNLRSVPSSGLALVDPGADPAAVPGGGEARRIADHGGWRAYRISCAVPEPESIASRAAAGSGSGGRR